MFLMLVEKKITTWYSKQEVPVLYTVRITPILVDHKNDS